MIHVQREQRAAIWMTVLVTEILLVLQAAAMTGWYRTEIKEKKS